MANYNYECLACKKKAFKKFADRLIIDGSGEKQLPPELYEEFVLFETSHSMMPSEEELREALECPRCGKRDAIKTMYGAEIHSYIRGYGWLDRSGIKRDMNRYTLANNDPYAQYREPGEADHIDSQLKKQGQHNPKTKHYAGSGKEMEKAVRQVISTPDGE
jgi:Zn-finger nucleic acid-binding protein